MKNFKIGDKVFVINNESWGLRPMTVKRVYPDCIICYNKHIKMDGGFYPEDLRHFTKGRDKKVKEYVSLKNSARLQKLKVFLFGKDRKDEFGG